MREDGFYWVKYCGNWVVAEWWPGFGNWSISGSEDSVLERELEEIDERTTRARERWETGEDQF